MRSLVVAARARAAAAARLVGPARQARLHAHRRCYAVPAYGSCCYARRRLPADRGRRICARGRSDALMAHWRLVTPALVRAVRGGGGELYVWTVDDARPDPRARGARRHRRDHERPAAVRRRLSRPASGRGRGPPSAAVWYACRMQARVDDTVALLAHVPAFGELGPAELGAWPRCPCRGASPPARRCSARATPRHLLHRPQRPRAGDPRAPRRSPDHARDVRPRRDLRRAGDVRRRAPLRHRRGDRRRSRRSRSSAPTCGG